MSQAKITIAGGVETVSDVQIEHSPQLRRELILSQKYKSNLDYVKLAGRVAKNYKTYLKPDWPEVVQEFSTKEIMGHSADRLCEVFGVSRESQDEFALRSHKRAKTAFESGLLTDIIPVTIDGKTDDKDNGVRIVPPEKMAKMKPVFRPGIGTVTGGNSSFFTDGATACLIGEETYVKSSGLSCQSYLRDWIFVAQDPKDELLVGPAYAIPKLLKRANLTVDDIDVWEIHEAFAGQVLSNLVAMKSDKWSSENSQEKITVQMDKINTWIHPMY
jgi:acetyl-CoA acyltransferase